MAAPGQTAGKALDRRGDAVGIGISRLKAADSEPSRTGAVLAGEHHSPGVHAILSITTSIIAYSGRTAVRIDGGPRPCQRPAGRSCLSFWCEGKIIRHNVHITFVSYDPDLRI